MTDAADLARRFLAAWEDHLMTLFSGASKEEELRCLAEAAGPSRDTGSRDYAEGERAGLPGPEAGAAPVGGSSD